MNKKRVIGIILLLLATVTFVVLGSMYAQFIATHRSEVIVSCTVGIVVIMGIRCISIYRKTTRRITVWLDDMVKREESIKEQDSLTLGVQMNEEG